MNEFDIAAPLAAALAAKGYASLTSVQQAVLAPEADGRDLLVSAQTGSGKTVAFGLAMAPQILNGQEQLQSAERPLALIIAPTRELALQVAQELRWLYGPAGAHIATCVGGMDYRTERRALERGAHIVVGTPGRLRDHLERGALDLSALRASVLDEADEMLDLGFREDLEFILGAAPADHRALMFSATVPAGIEALAREFQSDALRISAAGEARQHGDIEYRALSIALRDRDHAIFNLLRFYEARTAIIFCKTRAEVNRLLARMGNRGFRVVALSGELSQQERSHALQALRDGRARVCIATDVAARGIDLPGLELVIHADLPTNPEILLHRSGRTGRAGSKGVSALIVPAPDYRRAQSLLKRAKVVAEWGAAPSADEVQARDDDRLRDYLSDAPEPEDDDALAAGLIAEFGPQQIAAALIRLYRDGRPAPEELTIQTAATGTPPAPRERGEFGPSVWFSLSIGHSGRAEARWLLPKICEAGGITRDEIGAIRVRSDETFVQIAAPVADRLSAAGEIADGIAISRLAGEPDFTPAPRDSRRPHPARPAPNRKGPPFPRAKYARDRDDESNRHGERSGTAPRQFAPRPEPAGGFDPLPEGGKVRKPRWTAAERAKKSDKAIRPGKPAGKFQPGKPRPGKPKPGPRKPKG